MATWHDLVEFIRHQYEVVRQQPEEIRVRIHYGGDVDEAERTQIIVIARETLDNDDEWVQIATPFARVDEVDLATLLTEIGNTTVVGGAVIMGDYLVLRHSLPLVNLDLNEFVEPLELISGTAELLEEQFIGRDDY